jgi:transglutaminase-like putative cysteine protease
MQPEPSVVDASTETTSDEEAAAELAARLRSIEDLPLDQRATAFSAVHDELRTALEGTGEGTPEGTGETDDSPGGR